MRIPVIAALVGAAAMAAPAFAQDSLSVDDIRNAFQRQLSAQQTLKTRGLGGGQTRQLTLITVDDIKTDENGQQVVVTATAPSQPSAGETGTASSGVTSTASTGATGAATTAPVIATAQPGDTSPGIDTSPSTPSAGATVSATVPGQPAGDSTVTAASSAGIGAPIVYAQYQPDMQVNLQIEFGLDSAALDKSQAPKLEKMCIVLQTTPINKIRIVGHTDATGTEEYNERLSILRAREVARHLTDECGIDPGRLETVGLGERFPVNGTNPKADENRRVEFQALS